MMRLKIIEMASLNDMASSTVRAALLDTRHTHGREITREACARLLVSCFGRLRATVDNGNPAHGR
jgi:hypothetical protein